MAEKKDIYFLFEEQETGEQFGIVVEASVKENGKFGRYAFANATFKATKKALEEAKVIWALYSEDYNKIDNPITGLGVLNDNLDLIDMTTSPDIVDIWGVDVF